MVQTPLLLTFYFGDSCSTAQPAASARLRKWARAFDRWIEELRRDHHKNTPARAVLEWRRFVRHCGKLPWQVANQDIADHFAWMQQEGLSKSSLIDAHHFFVDFYRWCADKRLDLASGAGFNPALDVPAPSRRNYEGAPLWSPVELSALVELLGRDVSPLGKRDYAFILMRLNTGVPLKNLVKLKWGQLEPHHDGASVHWQPGSVAFRLPAQVWQAIKDYLVVSGRLAGMHAEKYIFVPLERSRKPETGTRASDWDEYRALESFNLLNGLKLYGQQLGIAAHKLTLQALRDSSIRMKLDSGESLEGMKAFLNSRTSLKVLRYRLGCLADLPVSTISAGALLAGQAELPSRKGGHLTGVEGLKHGLCSKVRDLDAVHAIVAENIVGVDDEIVCLRQLMRGLLEREGNATRLAEVYSLSALRLGVLVSASGHILQGQQDPRVAQFLSAIDEAMERIGEPPASQYLRQQALGLTSEAGQSLTLLTEEAATIRLLLRNAFRRATQEVDTREYVRIVDLYSQGCLRLARLLKIGVGDEYERLRRYWMATIDLAIRELCQEWGLD